MRHYELSSYLLHSYHPFVDLNGFLVMERNGTETSDLSTLKLPFQGHARFDDLYFRAGSCGWGYVPAFLDQPGGTKVSNPFFEGREGVTNTSASCFASVFHRLSGREIRDAHRSGSRYAYKKRVS